MMPNQGAGGLPHFFRHREIVGELTLPTLSQGDRHQGMAGRWRNALLLADRALKTAALAPDLAALPRRIGGALGGLGTHASTAGADLLTNCLEPWLKAILRLVAPDRFDRARKKRKHFNLFQVMKDLDLLEHHELEFDQFTAARIEDPVRRHVALAHLYRNAHIHAAPDLPSPTDIAPTVLVAMLAPIDLHSAALREACSRLVVDRGQPDQGVALLLDRVARERARHLEYIIGRDEVASDLVQRLGRRDRGESPYVLLTAPEGYGKSALAAMVTSTLGASWGGPDPACAGEYPWLPGPLLHMGKQSADPFEFVRSLLWQASTMLLDAPRDDLAAEPAPSRSAGVGDELSRPRGALFDALHRVVSETGSATLVIDALDEIASEDPERLAFLPTHPPAGAAVLLTCRPDARLVRWLVRHRQVDVRRLEGLSVEAVAEVTGVHDASWVQAVAEATDGSPLLVVDKARRVREQRGHGAVPPGGGPDAVFRGQAGEWTRGCRDDVERASARRLLATLALLEPVAPASASLLQRLRPSDVDPADREWIGARLDAVSSQLTGWPEQGAKLAGRAFAEWCGDEVLGLDGRRALLADLSTRLADDEDADAGFIARFLARWADPSQESDPKSVAAARELVDRLANGGHAERLSAIARAWPTWKWPHVRVDAAEVAERLGSPSARLLLGGRDFAESFSARLDDSELGAKRAHERAASAVGRLTQAAEGGEVGAMHIMGLLMTIEGNRADLVDRGLRFLRMGAAEEHLGCTIALGQALLQDNCGPDVPSSYAWLRKAADTGDPDAMYGLGVALDDGWLDELMGYEEAIEEGGLWLRRAAEAGSHEAMTKLARLYLEGGFGEEDTELGLRWARTAAEHSFPVACSALGMFLLGRTPHADGVAPGEFREGIDRLRDAVRLGDDRHDKAYLAFYVRRGETDPLPGEGPSLAELLRPGVLAGTPMAVMNEALRLGATKSASDWKTADELVRGLGVFDRWVRGEWQRRTKEGDPERDLVLAWVSMRHRHNAQESDEDVALRLKRAAAAGWPIAEWLGRELVEAGD